VATAGELVALNEPPVQAPRPATPRVTPRPAAPEPPRVQPIQQQQQVITLDNDVYLQNNYSTRSTSATCRPRRSPAGGDGSLGGEAPRVVPDRDPAPVDPRRRIRPPALRRAVAPTQAVARRPRTIRRR